MFATTDASETGFRDAARPKVAGRKSSYTRKLARMRKDVESEAQDRIHAVRRGVRDTLRRTKDSQDAVALEIRRHPIRAVAIGFAVGVTSAIFVGALARNLSRGDGAFLED